MLKPKKQLIKEFYKFINERQNIWYKKEVLKQQKPWTRDPILRKYKFTNVHRVLDKGTIFLLENILTKSRSEKEILFNVITYRFFNRIGTFKEIGFQKIKKFNINILRTNLLNYKAKGNKVFTNAFMVSGSIYPEEKDKTKQYCIAINELYKNLNRIYLSLKKSKTMQEAFNIFLKIKGVGEFLAYQILLDLMYKKILPFSENDWSIAGPGAKRGLNFIFGKLRKEEELNAMLYLYKIQRNFLNKNFYKMCNNKEISLSNIENCLCEFSKYYKAKSGLGRPRVKYV